MDNIATVFGWTALFGFIGLIVAFFIYATPGLVEGFGQFFYWLTAVVPPWFMNVGLAAQVALVSALMLLVGLFVGAIFAFGQADDKVAEPEMPL